VLVVVLVIFVLVVLVLVVFVLVFFATEEFDICAQCELEVGVQCDFCSVMLYGDYLYLDEVFGVY